jgi:uncharacterized repeat protein (TIGR02543 family)
VVLYGEDANLVTAVADTGYIFVKWSDGVIEAARADTNVQQDITVTAEFASKKFTVSYLAAENGRIEGATEQTIKYGGSSTTVTAIPDENYRFVRWSDSITEATRSDNNIKRDIKVTALFEELDRTFTYNYNNETDFYAEQNNTEEAILFKGETFTKTKLIVPIREHFTFDGWYLEPDFTTRVTNENGEVVIDTSLFDTESTNLYAKWNNITEPPVYKVLMVFVTEVHATLMSNKNPERIDIPIQVDYVMTDIERKICEKIPVKFQDWLNETFNGLVIFEVDTYFTTQPLGKESFILGGDENRNHTYTIYGYGIPEVRTLLPQYRSVMTTLGMNDYEGLLHLGGGVSGAKYGSVRLEALFGTARLNDVTYESILETGLVCGVDFYQCELGHYTHEFIHTVECWLGLTELGVSYHETGAYYHNNSAYSRHEDDRLYLLRLMEIDGKRVGIPYHFWENDVYYDQFLDHFGE